MLQLSKFESKLYNHGGEQGGSCSHGSVNANVQSFELVDLRVKEDVQLKAKELAELIAQSEEVQHFRQAEAKINNNERIQSLIQQIKKKQKEVVAFEQTFKNADMVKKIEAEMAALQDELDGIPIVTEFQQSQTDINYLLQLVVGIVRDTVAEKINVENAKVEDPDDCLD